DEARTPLIISGQVERPTERYIRASQVAKQLKRDREGELKTEEAVALEEAEAGQEAHYEVDEKAKSVILTDEGFAKAEEL
ncbi:hypothetical protein R0K19_27775, partial [Bacillus sp. SIMBA_161]